MKTILDSAKELDLGKWSDVRGEVINKIQLVLRNKSYLDAAYEFFSSGKNNAANMYTQNYFAYHYGTYLAFLYSFKESLAQFFNYYYALNISPLDTRLYSKVSGSLGIDPFLSPLFQMFDKKGSINSLLDKRKNVSHQGGDIVKMISEQEVGLQRLAELFPGSFFNSNVLKVPHELLTQKSHAIFVKIINDIEKSGQDWDRVRAAEQKGSPRE